jgi:hypothetical protein
LVLDEEGAPRDGLDPLGTQRGQDGCRRPAEAAPPRKVRPQTIPIPAKAKAMTPCVDPSHVAAIRLKQGDVIMCFDRCRDLMA